MKNIILATLVALSIFTGCSAKEFNEGVESIGNDISDVVKGGNE